MDSFKCMHLSPSNDSIPTDCLFPLKSSNSNLVTTISVVVFVSNIIVLPSFINLHVSPIDGIIFVPPESTASGIICSASWAIRP